MNTQQTAASDYALERLARRRAGRRMGWYTHAFVYLTVNLMLAALSLSTGRHWALFPAFGWGLGLMVHGIVVFVANGGGGLMERMVRHERAQLTAQRDPW